MNRVKMSLLFPSLSKMRIRQKTSIRNGYFICVMGISLRDDTLPERLLNEPKPDGPIKGVVISLEEIKDDFCG